MVRRQINAEELHELYALIGEGIWHLQNVEDALHTYLTIKQNVKIRGSMPPAQAEAILSKHRTNTLGTSLKISRDGQILGSSLQDRLDAFKEERDWLVHRSVHQCREDLYVDDKRFALMRRIQMFSEEAMTLQKLIAKELEDYVVAQGVSREWVYHYAQGRINKLKGEEP